MRIAALILLAASLASCQTSDQASPWAPLVWSPCHDDFECASVEVPVDYDEPDGAKIALALSRALATAPEERIGSVLVNPGGPGTGMVEQLWQTYRTLAVAFPEAVRKFDVVAFDWRGVGGSAALRCVDDAFFDRLRAVDLTLDQPDDVAPAASVADTLAQGCRATGDPRLLAHMDTESAARDLDRIRAALGDDRLNYLGFSYGTWLGATYATLFPQRVRAFALDSPVVVPADPRAYVKRRAAAQELGLQRFFDACSKDPACAFHGGAEPSLISAELDALASAVRTGDGVAAGDRRLRVVDLGFALADGLRAANTRKLADDLASAEAGDGSALLARADAAAGRSSTGAYDGRILGLVAISCLDLPFEHETTESLQSFMTGLALPPRSAGAAVVPWAACIGWPWRREKPAVPIGAPSAAPMLVIAGRFDPITSYEQGPAMVDALHNGSHLLTYEGDGHSASFHSACVREAVTRYFVDPAAPPATSCPAEGF